MHRPGKLSEESLAGPSQGLQYGLVARRHLFGVNPVPKGSGQQGRSGGEIELGQRGNLMFSVYFTRAQNQSAHRCA